MDEQWKEGVGQREAALGAERREERREGERSEPDRSDDRSGAPSAGARPGCSPAAACLDELGEREEWDGEDDGGNGGDGDVDPVFRRAPPGSPRKGRRLVKPEATRSPTFTPEQRLLLLDIWKRSGLAAGDFAPLIGLSRATLCSWRQRFERLGPQGLLDQPRGAPKGSRLPEVTRRTILMLKDSHPEYGCQRISDELARGPALGASATAVGTVLKEAGYVLEEVTSQPHDERVRRFERASPNQLWQTDLFTFMLKRQNRRVHLVAFLDDHSRFVVGYGLYASPTAVLVIETLRSAIVSYGPPEEVLTDNGPQYVTWRGTSAFRKELDKQGIKHIVAHPKRPQTLGKVERFWGSLWRECLERVVFKDAEEARVRVGLYIDHYNFHRPHQGIDGVVPADRYFGAAPEVLRTLKERVAANALELAQHGVPRSPLYLAGQVGGKSVALHAAGERVFLSKEGERRQEIDLGAPAGPGESLPEPVTPTMHPRETAEAGSEEPLPPGVSVLDELSSGTEPPADGGDR
jgi:transposase InsO family protein